MLPLLAMSRGTPCAAAMYSRSHEDRHDTYTLRTLFRNAGEDCKGGGAAILCYLIRNSQNTEREFRPLRLFPLHDEQNLTRYYESFGCFERASDDLDSQKQTWMFCSDP